jgi:hypothetical protein
MSWHNNRTNLSSIYVKYHSGRLQIDPRKKTELHKGIGYIEEKDDVVHGNKDEGVASGGSQGRQGRVHPGVDRAERRLKAGWGR